MFQISGVILCLAYILGLLSSAVPWGGFGVLTLGIVTAFVFSRRSRTAQKPSQKKGKPTAKEKTVPHSWQTIPKPKLLLAAGVIGLLASFYFQVRVPQPTGNDISKFITSQNNSNQEQIVTVQGKVATTPRVTRSQKGQFWLEAKQLDEVKSEKGPAGASKGVTGKLYVTVPLLQATGLYPGQYVAVTGVLYKPKPAANPGAFDFQKFLKHEGSFAGLSGRQVTFPDEDQQRPWGWWQIRQRIVRSQVRWLGIPEGPLVSSMVLGSKAVDLPYDIRDLFVQAGLAHALAASGFQTSLILVVVLTLARGRSVRSQFTLGCTALIIFLCLTGFQPSVLRAVIMGFGALIALALKRKIKTFGSLLVAATLLLLFNPLWIWDLGFQLSFLATLGLLVTVPSLISRLDWLPTAIASLIAVPIAATIWTLPAQLHIFGVVPAYSLAVNVLTTPLISIISIGGIISALAGVVWPLVGSVLAWLLYYPTHWLINLVQFFTQLPGNSVAVGTISVWQVLGIYGLILLAWLVRWWQKRWWLAGLIAVSLVFIPIWQTQTTSFRVTVLADGEEPILIIQDHGKVTLINSGDDTTARFTVLPFLQQHGVNQIDWAIASASQVNTSDGWLELLQRLPIKTFYDYSHSPENALTTQAIQKAVAAHQGKYEALLNGQEVKAGSTAVQLIDPEAPILQFNIQGQAWLLMGNLKPHEQKELAKSGNLPQAQVLWWSGESLSNELVVAIAPKVVIASSAKLDPQTLLALGEGNTQVFWTGRDGAIQWTPNGKFEAIIEATENKASAL